MFKWIAELRTEWQQYRALRNYQRAIEELGRHAETHGHYPAGAAAKERCRLREYARKCWAEMNEAHRIALVAPRI